MHIFSTNDEINFKSHLRLELQAGGGENHVLMFDDVAASDVAVGSVVDALIVIT